MTRGLAAGPERFEGRSRYKLVSKEAAVGSVGGWGGTNSDDLGGSSKVQREFLFENFVVGAFPQPWRIVAAVL